MKEDIYTHLKQSTKAKLEEEFKKHSSNLSSKLRNQKQQESKENRYKLVNCKRSHNSKSSESDLNKTDYTVYDLEDTSDTLEKENGGKFVYDLYYTSEDMDNVYFEDYVKYESLEFIIYPQTAINKNSKNSIFF